MRGLLHRTVRAGATVACAATVMMLGSLLPAAPAHAAAGPGYGWAGSWNFYRTGAFEYAGTLPGVKVTGRATDADGTRRSAGTVQDTADDGRCARVWVFVPGRGHFANTTTCGNGTAQTFFTESFSGETFVFVQRLLPNSTGVEANFVIYIPDSTNDPELRTVGTGANWHYSTNDWFHYQVTRPGLRILGHGANGSAGQRSSMNTIEKTTTAQGCASGRASADIGTPLSATTCNSTFATFSTSLAQFGGMLTIEGCFHSPNGQRCNRLYIPEPA